MATAALVGCSTKLGNAIKKTMSAAKLAKRVPDEAHHLLSSKEVVIMLDADFYAAGHPNLMAASAGYELNGASNGIFLPAFFGHQMKVKRQRHKGNHYDIYYSKVEGVVRPIYEKFDGQNLCKDPKAKKKFLGAMKNAESNVRGKVSRRTLWLYDWSKPLWDADYRDEGTGNLNVPRAPVTDWESGMDWLKQTAGAVKRRWILQGKKKRKVVNKAWYGAQGYPKPGGLT
jgi:HNH/ENDO VII superfamily nuclease